jgi:hypothetical protein
VQLALALGVDNMPPLGMEPTQAEKSTAIFYMLAGGEPGDFEVDPSVIPPPHNKIAPGTVTKTVWATNVVYWLCYVYPSSAWVTSGHAPAPIKIPEDSLWLVVWNRIYTLMSNYG